MAGEDHDSIQPEGDPAQFIKDLGGSTEFHGLNEQAMPMWDKGPAGNAEVVGPFEAFRVSSILEEKPVALPDTKDNKPKSTTGFPL